MFRPAVKTVSFVRESENVQGSYDYVLPVWEFSVLDDSVVCFGNDL